MGVLAGVGVRRDGVVVVVAAEAVDVRVAQVLTVCLRVVVGAGTDPRAGAMQAALDRLNRAPAGAPPHLPELVTKEIVARRGQETYHPDGGCLRFSLYLPMPGFRFAGFSADTAYVNLTLALCMALGRLVPIALVLALAGSLAAQRRRSETAGTLPTHTPSFVGLLVGIALIVAGLTFFPALSLGPIAEALS